MVKRGSPIIIGIGENEYFAASDASALLPYTQKIISLNDDEMAVLNADGYYIKNLNNEFLQKEIEICAGRDYLADKKGYDHFMLKEIFEQPEAIENAFRGRLVEAEGVSKLGGLEPVMERLKRMKKLIIVSCGTSYYAGLLGRYIFESMTELHCRGGSRFRIPLPQIENERRHRRARPVAIGRDRRHHRRHPRSETQRGPDPGDRQRGRLVHRPDHRRRRIQPRRPRIRRGLDQDIHIATGDFSPDRAVDRPHPGRLLTTKAAK